MPTPFAILGIDHIVLRAADPAALEHFYREVLGCAFEKRQGKLTQLAGLVTSTTTGAVKSANDAVDRRRALDLFWSGSISVPLRFHANADDQRDSR